MFNEQNSVEKFGLGNEGRLPATEVTATRAKPACAGWEMRISRRRSALRWLLRFPTAGSQPYLEALA